MEAWELIRRYRAGERDFAGVNLIRAKLSWAGLRRVDLSGADLREANLSGADLFEACLTRADLRGADLSEASLQGADVREADLSEANLRETYLNGTDLSEARLARADLHGADLSEANLADADLSRADLSEAFLEGANLEGAKVTQEQLAQAKSLEGATLPDGAKYTGEAEPAPAEPEATGAEGQPDHPLRTEGYERWHSSVVTLSEAYWKWYSNIGPQSRNAVLVELLKHVRETRAQMSDAEAQDIWSAHGRCDRCGCSISPGDPYRVTSISRGGEVVPVDVLECIECAYGPNFVRVFSPPDFGPWGSFDFGRIRAAVSDMEDEVGERWMRQDRLQHRGIWWRLKRWARWWSAPTWSLPPMVLAHQPSLLQRLVAAWQLRRLRNKIRKSLLRVGEAGHQERKKRATQGVVTRYEKRKKRAAQRVVTRYERGKRRFVRAELAGLDLRRVNLEDADLSMADLTWADLSGANMASAKLVRADLEGAALGSADLRSADLSRANLFGAFLARADLQGANLQGANLGGANLYQARVTDDQLAETFSLKGALLPDGTVHK